MTTPDPFGWGRLPVSDEDAWWPPSGASNLQLVLNRAQLPRAELLYMGAPVWLLDLPQQRPMPPADAAALLGRIAWDAKWGNEGAVWSGSRTDHRDAMRLGQRVLKDWGLA